MTIQLGSAVAGGETTFAVRSPAASVLWLCLFDGDEERQLPMKREGDNWLAYLRGDRSGSRYGFRALGDWSPEQGRYFDPSKLLVDPYAVELDRRFVQDGRLATFGANTADLVPRAIVQPPRPDIAPEPLQFKPGGLIYELNVRGFTMLHPEVPQYLRGTIAALAHHSVIAHFRKLHVSAIELMPIVAWIDERHLPPLGLRNAWGYNPVVMMALDPGLAPGGVAELRDTVAALHAEGIGVILDIVFNHTGESDVFGGVLSLRGLDNNAYAHEPGGRLINDTGCGNTLDFSQEPVRRLALDSLRHFVRQCGIDGFRFDLAPIMAREPGFSASAPIFDEIAADPILADRIMIAEPWDIGPGGYQLGSFPANWLEWNDRFRDDVRRFWKGDAGVDVLATRIAGSSDVFGARCRSVNFLAAHDGFTLVDTVSYASRHNEANGEDNRDGHAENFSWNNGIEGATANLEILERRSADQRAMLQTLFASIGSIMLTAGDEFSRSQLGNNNAYAQDNEITWIDWDSRDTGLEAFVSELASRRNSQLDYFVSFPEPGCWSRLDGHQITVDDWENPETPGFVYVSENEGKTFRLIVDRKARRSRFAVET